MKLLQLPLECFRHVMYFVALGLNPRELVQLRYVNRAMAREVLYAMEAAGTFHPGKRPLIDNDPCYPRRNYTLPLNSSYIEFVASFLLIRPYRQEPWNANLSSTLNHIVDELLRDDGKGKELAHDTRECLFRQLCHEVFELNDWKESRYWLRTSMYLYEDWASETESLEFNVLLARIVLGRRISLADFDEEELVHLSTRRSCILGTILDVCGRAGQIDMILQLVQVSGVNIIEKSDKVLEAIIRSNDATAIRHLGTLDPRLSIPGRCIIDLLLKAIDNDRPEAALYIVRTCDRSSVLHYAPNLIGSACNNGHLAVLKALVEDRQLIQDDEFPEYVDKGRLFQYAAWFGHQDIVAYLVSKGATVDPLALRAAARRGDVAMARLLRAHGATLPPDTWCRVLMAALLQESGRSAAFICAMLDESFISAQALADTGERAQLLMEEACIQGHVGLVRALIQGGMSLPHLRSWEAGDSSVKWAVSCKQVDVVNAFLDMGSEIGQQYVQSARQKRKGGLPDRTQNSKRYKGGYVRKTVDRRVFKMMDVCQW